jgi:hypothetical protein
MEFALISSLARPRNRLFFQTSRAGSPADHQNTATVGLVWWYGGKEGAW